MSPLEPPQSHLKPTDLTLIEGWLHYRVHAFPHHTDYAGVVWHGTYVNWMEEARVEWYGRLGYITVI